MAIVSNNGPYYNQYTGSNVLPMNLNAIRYFGRSGSGSSGVAGGGSAGGSGSAAGGMTLSQMLEMQRSENAKTRAMNQAAREATLGRLEGVATAFEGDPMWQATRQSAMQRIADPEAINDYTQQLIQNRSSNQVNAAADSSRNRMRQQLASMGMLGSSAEQGALGQVERDRIAGLSDASTKLEIERANRRNQDILSSQQMGAALAGQQSGVNQFVAGKRADTDLYFQPENLSGYAGYFAGGGRGMFGAAGPKGTLNNEASRFGFNPSTLNQQGRQSPGQTGFAPGLRGNYQWSGGADQVSPNYGYMPGYNDGAYQYPQQDPQYPQQTWGHVPGSPFDNEWY
jgi:hypothetical protein